MAEINQKPNPAPAAPQGSAVLPPAISRKPEEGSLQLPKPIGSGIAAEVEKFAAALGSINGEIQNTLRDTSLSLKERVDKVMETLNTDALKAAKVSGLGEFTDLTALENFLRREKNVVFLPSLEVAGQQPHLQLTLLAVKPQQIARGEADRLLSGFTKTTNIEAPKEPKVYIIEKFLYDSDPKHGPATSWGCSTPGEEPIVLINREMIRKNPREYHTSAAEKEKFTLANELVTLAYTQKYPKLMATPLAPIVQLNGLQVAPIQIAELASDYAALAAGEPLQDVMNRMAVSKPGYALSNMLAAETMLHFIAQDKNLKEQARQWIEEAQKTGKDPGPYALTKMLETRPELHAAMAKELRSEMESTLSGLTPVLMLGEIRAGH